MDLDLDSIKEENIILEENRNMAKEDNDVNMEKVEEKKPLTIVFCIPGNNFSNNFLYSWTELFGYCIMNNINPILSNSYDSNVFFVRNKCLMGNVLNGIKQKPFQGKIDYDYIMWIDSDQVFNVEMFKRLLSYDVPVVSGCYLMANAKQYAAVQQISQEYLVKNGSYEFLTPSHIENWKNIPENKNNNLMKVAYSGMGFMLMKKGILEQIDYPWFKPSVTTLKTEEGEIIIQDYNSEDFYMCQKIQELGIPIYLDTSVIVGHEKKLIL
jgi:hypothetical protein